MISFLDPRVWLAMILVGALAFVAGDLGAHRKDKQAAALVAAQADAAVNKAQSEAQAQVSLANQQSQDKLNAIEENHEKEKQDAETKIASLRNDVRTGAVRLSIATRSTRPNAGTSNATIASVDQETRSELVPEAADALISIAADGDAGMRDLNACIDSYNSAKDTIKQFAANISKAVVP